MIKVIVEKTIHEQGQNSEVITSKENLNRAYKNVVANKGKSADWMM